MFKDLKKPYLIAELSGNHNGSIDRAKEIIKSAKENGADCIKLQTYTPDTMTIKSTKDDFIVKDGLWNGYSLWDLYEWAHTPFEWQKELFEYAESLSIDCISTPFDESAVDLLEDIGTKFYKIASFEVTDLPLIRYIAKKQKPIIISSGMADQSEIQEALEVIRNEGISDLVLLHCVSGYPTPIDQINLSTINLLRDTFNIEIGLSDHTLGNVSALMSMAYGVKVIEKHYTLSRADGGPDAAFSMEPDELRSLSNDLKEGYLATGTPSFKRKSVEESNVKFRRSLYVIKDMKKGETFSEDNIRRIRPGYGLSPKFFDDIIGKISNQEIERGTPISWDLVQK